MALEILYGYQTRIKKEEIYHALILVARHTGVPLAVNKAIVGEMAFTHESGIHAHGVIREPSTYESVTTRDRSAASGGSCLASIPVPHRSRLPCTR